MTVDPARISIDKCYVTLTGQVRRVLGVTANDVTYEARGKKNKPFPWGGQITVNRLKFANDVDREVPCHYDPDFSN